MNGSRCENFTGYLIGTKSGSAIRVRLRCKQWSCEYCAAINANQWQGHLLNTVDKMTKSDGGWMRWYLLTVTADGQNRTAHGSAASLQAHWNVIRQLFSDQTKKMGQRMSYVRVFESHKDGSMHLHAIVRSVALGNAWVDSRRAAKAYRALQAGKSIRPNEFTTRLKGYTMSKSGLGFMSEIVPIVAYDGYNDVAVIAAYVVKYLTKECQSFDLPKGARRIVTSRDMKFVDVSQSSEYKWRHVEEFTADDLYYLLKEYPEVYDVNENRAVTYDDICFSLT